LNADIVLELNHLRKTFGDVVAVDNLSLQIKEGEIFALLGPNGAGKTTTINLIAGLLKLDQGQIVYKGKIRTAPENDLVKTIGVCYQENVHWNKLTPSEQLIFLGRMYGISPKIIRQRSRYLLAELDLEDNAHRQAGNLSGGMQRRLNIALALVHDPDLIIFDEPEAGQDPQSRIKIRDFIKSLARDKTVILTTHNMDEAERLADRVAIIDRGRLLVLDSPEILIKQAGEGDVLEISFSEQISLDESINLGLDRPVELQVVGNMLQIRALDLINLLPRIIDSLSKQGIPAEDIRLRKNTLEDVFIQLTGRRLRE
jgi:ABC-2 type transport system ATP-binding protein